MILSNRQSIKQDLTAYGEIELAKKIGELTDDELNQIGHLAAKHIGMGGYISKHVAMGAIEFMEGQAREPKRKRRDMSAYDEPEPKENSFARLFRRKKN